MKTPLKRLCAGVALCCSVLTAWAADPIATWTQFTDLTADSPLQPTYSATVNEIDGSAFRFHLGGGTVSNGTLATGTAAAPYITFDANGSTSLDIGYNSTPLTVLLKLSVPITAVDGAPLVNWASANNTGIGLASAESASSVRGAWQNAVWNNTARGTISSLAATETSDIYLAVYPGSGGLLFAEVSAASETLSWTTLASGLKSRSLAATYITFGNYVNATSGGINFTLKAVSVLNGQATLAELQSAISDVETTCLRTLSGTSTVWNDATAWSPSVPTATSTALITLSADTTLTMDTTATVSKLTVQAKEDALHTLTLAAADGGSLTASTTRLLQNAVIESGAAALGAVTVADTATLTVKDLTSLSTFTAFSNVSGNGTVRFSAINSTGGALPLNALASTTSVELDGVTCYLASNLTAAHPITLANDGLTVNNGYSNQTATFSGALSGSGTLSHAKSLPYYLKFTNPTDFEGSVSVTGSTSSVIFGSGDVQAGKIVVAAKMNVASGKTWSAPNGVAVTSSGTLGGSGTINGALTLESGATLAVTSTASTLTASTLTLGTTLTVTADTLPTEGTLPLISGLTEAPSNAATVAVKAICGDETDAVSYYLAYENGVLSLKPRTKHTLTFTGDEEEVTYSSVISSETTLGEGAVLILNFADTSGKSIAVDCDKTTHYSAIYVYGTYGGTVKLTEDAIMPTCNAMAIHTNLTAPVAFYNGCSGTIAADDDCKVGVKDSEDASLTAQVRGGILTQEGENTLTVANNYNVTATPTAFAVNAQSGILTLGQSSVASWNDPPGFIVSGGTLDLNGVYTFTSSNGSGYLTSADPLFTMGGVKASCVKNGNVTPYTASSVAQTFIHYLGGNGENAPASFEANLHSVYTSSARTRTIIVEKGAQPNGYDLDFCGTLGVSGGEFAGTTLVKEGEGILRLSGENNLPTLTLSAGSVVANHAEALSTTTSIAADATLDICGQTLSVTNLSGSGTLKDSATTKGSLTVTGAFTFTGKLENVKVIVDGAVEDLSELTAEGATLQVDLSDYTAPMSLKVAGLTIITTGELPDYLAWDEDTSTITFAGGVLSDTLIWLPIGDSITEGETYMGHPDLGDANTRGGYRYQLWSQLEEIGQATRTVGFRTGHYNTVEADNTAWAWHGALYGGAIKYAKGDHGCQWYNVESALEVAGYPDVITILIGINDLSFLSSDSEDLVTKIYEDWTALVTKYATLRPHAKIVVSTLLPTVSTNASANRYPIFNKKVRAAATDKADAFAYSNVILVDCCALAFNDTYNSAYFKDDGIHPNEVGSKRVARAWMSGIARAIQAIQADDLVIAHVHNATEGQITVRLNKAVESASLTLTIEGSDFAGKTVSTELTAGTLDETDKRVITFTSAPTLHNGHYTVTLKGSVNGVALATPLTADGATVEFLGSGAAENVPPEYLRYFKHRKTYTVAGTDGTHEASLEVDGADATATLSAPERVAYYVELQRAGAPAQFVWVAMDAFDESGEAALGLPTESTGVHQTQVTNVSVFGNRGNFDKGVSGRKGLVEFTPYAWTATDKSDGLPEGYAGKFGWNDTLSESGTLQGCMQVALISEPTVTSYDWQTPAAQMLFAYNNIHSSSQKTDIGIGSFVTHHRNAGGSSIPIVFDWTNFSEKTGYTKFLPDAYSVKKIELWVSEALSEMEIVTETTEEGEDGESTSTTATVTINNPVLLNSLIEKAIAQEATSLKLSEVQATDGTKQATAVADAADIFVGVDEVTVTEGTTVADAVLKYDFGISNMRMTSDQSLILEIKVSNAASDEAENTAAFANGVTFNVLCNGEVVTLEEVADLEGTSGTNTGATRYFKVACPTAGASRYTVKALK